MMSETEIPESLIIRKPALNDAKSIYNLVKKCPPLEVNTLYSYMLISSHFDDTSAVAEINQELVGYTSGYLHPHKTDTLFIWQIAVLKAVRGYGIAREMILNILKRKLDIKYLEATVTPQNQASKTLFTSISDYLDAPINETLFYSRDDFGELEHDEEFLIKIGPLKSIKSILPVSMGE